MKRIPRCTLLAAALSGGLILGLQAQSLTLDWITVDGGGGTAVAPGLELQITIGQPDAGAARGGPYLLETSFWPGPFAPATPVPPALSVGRTPDGLALSWPAALGPVVLERAVLLGPGGAWDAVPVEPVPVGGDLRVVLSPGVGTAFYRLRLGGP